LPANYFGKGRAPAGNIFNQFTQLKINLIGVERKTQNNMHHGGQASEEIIRKIERELDLEERRLKLEVYAG
jgi:CPA1 family monovalent cation:H+ antiporter